MTPILSKHKKSLLFIFTIFHFTIITLATFLSGYSTAREYFNDVDSARVDSLEPDLLEKSIRKIVDAPGITPYAIISGIDAGYGFFAPNVASSYIIECAIKDNAGKIISRTYSPNLVTHEGRNRYETLVSDFQERLKALEKPGEKSLYTRYLDIVLKSIGKNMYNQSNSDDKASATVTLYLYDYPNLSDYIVGHHEPALISLISYNID